MIRPAHSGSPRPSSDEPLAVRCRGVIRDFGDGDSQLRVLHGIDLEVRTGELTLLVGPSGCGKTTLLSIICGLLEPTAGEIELFGIPRRELSGARLVEFRGRQIGFVFQQYNLLPSLTAAENAAVPLLIGGVPRARAVARAEQVLATLGLADRTTHIPAHLSGGQQQRVAIARALVHEPRLLVCDEPTAALDAQSGRSIMQLLRQVALQTSRAVLIVTHDQRVYEFGDRVVTMSDGRIERVEELGARGEGAASRGPGGRTP